MNRWLSCLVVVTSTLAVVPSASADANSEARVFFEEGNRHLAAALRLRGDRRARALEQALAAYVSSVRIVRSRNAVYNAGIALDELDRDDEAYGYFTEYVGMEGVSDADRAEAQRRIEAIRPRVAVIAAASTPAGAEVRIDRRDLAARGTTPLEVAVPPGAHTLWFSREGYVPEERRVTAAVGERQELSVEMVATTVMLRVLTSEGTRAFLDNAPIAANTELAVRPGRHVVRIERPDGTHAERNLTLAVGAGPTELDTRGGAPLEIPERAHVLVETAVAARVLANGRPLGTGTRVSGDVEAGNVLLHVEAEGHAPFQTTLTLRPDQTARVRAHLEVSRAGESRLGSWPLVSGIVTVAAGGAAIAFSLRATFAKSDFDDALQRNQEDPGPVTAAAADAAADTVDDANRLADIFWVTTAVLATTTLVLALANGEVEQRPSTASVALAPVAGGAVVVAQLPWGGQ